MAFPYFSPILLVRIMPLGLVWTLGVETTQEFEYQEAGVIGSHIQNLPTPSPKAILGKLSRYEVVSATMIPLTILD